MTPTGGVPRHEQPRTIGEISFLHRWIRDWDSMMDAYLPGRADLTMAAMQTAETVLGGPPGTVLDLGGGPGATARKLLRRWPASQVSLLDLDPVLLGLARAAAPGATIRRADLATGRWRLAAGGPYDLVLAVMTLHHFPEGRVRQLYPEIRRLLRPGGLLLVAEPMPERAPPSGLKLAGSRDPWTAWWRDVASHPAMAGQMRARARVMTGRTSAEFVAGPDWHRTAVWDAGYAESWLAWCRDGHTLLAARNT